MDGEDFRPNAIFMHDGGRPASPLRAVPPTEAVARLSRQILSDPTVTADQALLDRVVDLALTVPVFERDPRRQGIVDDLSAGSSPGGTGGFDAAIRRMSEAGSGLALDGVSAERAFFRRAEGITVRWRSGGEPMTVVRKGLPSVDLPGLAVSTLVALTDWRRPAAGEAPLLAALAEHGLAWFSDVAWDRTLPGGSLGPGAPALRRPFQPVPLFARGPGGRPRPLSFMPRSTELDGLELVGFEFRGHRRGHDVGGVVLIGDAAYVGALRRLLPELVGRTGADELIEALPPAMRAAGHVALRDLADAALLEGVTPGTDDPAWIEGGEQGVRAAWLGHASVVLGVGGAGLWIDPTTAPRQHQAPIDEVAPPVAEAARSSPRC